MCLGHPGTKAYEYKKSSSCLCGTPEKLRCQCLLDRMWKNLWQQTHLKKPLWPGQISPASNLVLGFCRCSFVAVVASGKSSQVHLAAWLSDPDLTMVRYSAFLFCLDHDRVVYWAPEVIGNQPVQPEHCSPSSVLYTSTHRISMECNIKLLISHFKACNGLGSWYKKGHHAVEWGVKMRVVWDLWSGKIAWQDCGSCAILQNVCS